MRRMILVIYEMHLLLSGHANHLEQKALSDKEYGIYAIYSSYNP